LRLAAAVAGVSLALGATGSLAQMAGDPPPAAPATASGPTDSVVINLIRLLVKQGVISQAAADALVKEAEVEAAQARAGAAPGAAPGQMAQGGAPPPGPGVLRVPYVPQIVKNQIRDEVKQEVMAEAKSEGWAAPGEVPDWVGRITWNGDFRFRDEYDLFNKSNTNQFIDFAQFNASGPFDINPGTNLLPPPFLNTRQNRENQLSVRLRLGMTAKVTDHVTVGVRLASGNDTSPVSTTQALGANFGKKNFWLDQAYIKFDPVSFASATFGRMPNPFVHTDLVFDDNLNFDGVAATVRTPWGYRGFTGALTGGAFPVGYLPGAFPTNSELKNPDRTKWLFAGQFAVNWTDGDRMNAHLAVADYYYSDIRGVLSDPCAIYTGIKQCSSDSSQPAFMQKGNTLFLLRDIVPDPANPLNYAQPQFVGLAYNYNELDVNALFDARVWGDRHVIVQGDFVHNFAYNENKAFAYTNNTIVNNFEEAASGIGPYRSGPNAWMAKITFGNPTMDAAGNWNVMAGYKYIEPDAVVDAFNDHDFHMGGTNAKGYFIFANYAFYKHTWASLRWFSSNEVYGPPLAIDLLQLELNAAF
jgi:hypothetical protein